MNIFGEKPLYGSFTNNKGNRMFFETEDALLNPLLDVLEAEYGELRWIRLSYDKDEVRMNHETGVIR